MTARAFVRNTFLPSALFLLGTALLILRPLASFWNRNDAYSFGWYVPLLAGYLLAERWLRRPEAAPVKATRPAGVWLAGIGLAWGFFLLATRLVTETEPESRPVLWLNASLLVGATLAWFGMAGGRRWLRHFAFPVAFLFLSVPWIFRLEFFLVQGLMRLNAAAVADTLVLLDIPARAAGNTILLTNGQLDVSQACSGIRSFQAALMMSLFFGEFYRFRLRQRLLLPLVGAALALTGNYARMLFLAWHGARHGIATVVAMHDSAGVLILGFTVLSLWLICLALRDRPLALSIPPRSSFGPPAPRLAFLWAAGLFLAALLAEGATQGWYGWRERAAPRFATWTVAWPAALPSFHRWEIPPSAHEKLHDSAESAAAWRDDAGWSWSGLWIRYHAQAADKVIFEAHNPELCLPAAGWRQIGKSGEFFVQVGQIHLLVRSDRFEFENTIRYVFWVPYLDRGAAANADGAAGLHGHSLLALAQLKFPVLADVWAGCRGADAETLEVALAGPAGEAEAEKAFRGMLAHLVLPEATATVATRER